MGADELDKIDVDNLIDSIEQKIVSKHKTIIAKNELIKIVLDTIKPISLKTYVSYLSQNSDMNSKRDLNKLINSL